MENITAKKDEVLAALRENRAQHRAIFEEAVEGYQAEATRLLESHLERVRSGKRYPLMISLAVPEDHTKDYDRAIRMIELDVAETVVLTEFDVQQYVMDDWRWKQQFLASNASYSATATRMLES